ncbi:Cleavage and polyadenylation specificity factor [Operophtera brumata]|uniref:Cleavage and polyadenylation specificity factor subunit 6 n=1 Tax=Operophtera brumata TaxID=104452 RepID=A0A0L7LCF3_OPEBR|nr:Cleavage and polyadenylation specificity factor [Operophtera brumata]
MADGGVDIDLYADDIESDFNRQDEFGGENVDLYDDVIAAPPLKPEDDGPPNSGGGNHHPTEEQNGNSYHSNGPSHGHHGRRFQLYVGNLTWWATDQDIANAIQDVGVNDFQDVKFFENRANGQSKGFCVISLGSDQSLRMVLDRLPKKDIHGQQPVVTLPTKQALNQFESQSKTRSTPPGPNNGPGGMRGPPGHPGGPPGSHPGGGPGGPHHQMRGPPQGPPHHPPHHMQHQGPPPPHHMQHPGPPPHQGPPPGHRPPMQMQRPPGPRPGPEWGPRGPHMPPQQPPQYGPPQHQMPHQMPPPHAVRVGPGAPAPHVNPAFFNQQPQVQPAPGGPPPQQQGPPGPGAPYGHPPHGAPPPSQGPLPGRQPYGRPPQPARPHHGAPPAPHPAHPAHPPMPVISEAEFEEVMSRNRTVSSSAIARAVSDAAAGEYASAIETLVTAISLIKQSKVAQDDRCKILISSLQDTLHGVETKSYSSGERARRSRSRDRDRDA